MMKQIKGTNQRWTMKSILLLAAIVASVIVSVEPADAAGNAGIISAPAMSNMIQTKPLIRQGIRPSTRNGTPYKGAVPGNHKLISGPAIPTGIASPRVRKQAPAPSVRGPAGRMGAGRIGTPPAFRAPAFRAPAIGKRNLLREKNRIGGGFAPSLAPALSTQRVNIPRPKGASPLSANPERHKLTAQQQKKRSAKLRAFYRKIPLDPTVRKSLLATKPAIYTVVTKGISGRNKAFQRRVWKGKIILPDLALHAKPVRIKNAGMPGGMTQWFLKNPDGSMSKQILNGSGKKAGNITFTKDGSVRIGLDLTGNKEADLYELIASDGEHTILTSPAGRAALEHFRNGGTNPLCNPGAASTGGGRLAGAAGARGVRTSGGGFAGGMISGTSSNDKTAIQVACGRKHHKPGSGGSAAGGGGRISGDPGGRTTDAMCKGVLSRHRGRPGAGGMTMDPPVGSGDDSRTFHWDRFFVSLLDSILQTQRAGDDAAADAAAESNPGSDALGAVSKIPGPVGEAAGTAQTLGDALNAGDPFVNEADRGLNDFENQQDPGDNTHPDPAVVNAACSAGSTSKFCGPWHRDHDQANSGGNGGSNGGGNASDPGPDQQNDPDAAMLAMCQARAKSNAFWASIGKDTRYVHQLCDNPASQPNPAGKSGSATLGGSYGSSVTLATYCGQHGGKKTTAPSPEQMTQHAGGGRNCGRTESPGTDGRCHGVGTRFNGGSAGTVNVSYGSVIGIPAFDPRVTNPSPQ